MDFVYTDDIARANVLAAKRPVTDEVYNIGSGTETSLLDLARALLARHGPDLPCEFGPARAVNGVTRRLADVSRAARATSAGRPEVEPGRGSAAAVAWWRERRQSEVAERASG